MSEFLAAFDNSMAWGLRLNCNRPIDYREKRFFLKQTEQQKNELSMPNLSQLEAKLRAQLERKESEALRRKLREQITEALAETGIGALDSAGMAAIASHKIEAHLGSDSPDLSARIRQIKALASAVKRGDLTGVEESLISQAHACESLFAALSAYACELLTRGEIGGAIALLQVAMTAQRNSRQALIGAASARNPKQTTFVKQQLNHLQIEQQELYKQLEASRSEPLDARTQTASPRQDLEVETLGAIDWAENSGGESHKRAK